ncbi:NAD(P)-dependent oxidoreductase [soil metagenome]
MRVLIFGVNGMLGHKLYQRFGANFDVYGTIRSSFESVERYGIFERERVIENVDAAKFDSVRKAIELVRPDVVVNAIGIIKQLPSSKDVIQTLSINSIFPNQLAELSAEFGFRLITISTDCVFSGAKGNYSESDTPDARDLYGMSKLLGEPRNHGALTIRTSIIGRELSTGHSIVEWFLSNRGGNVKGFEQAIYTGFPSIVLADIILRVITDQPDVQGVWHISSDPISKLDLLRLINEKFNARVEIEPSTELAIDRSLDSTKYRELSGFKPALWEEMVARMAADPTPYESWR